jgi:hypothetical protein
MPDSNIYIKSFLGYKLGNLDDIMSETFIPKILFLPFILPFLTYIKSLDAVFIPWKIANIFLESVAAFLLAYYISKKHKSIKGTLLILLWWSLDPMSILITSKFLSYFPIYFFTLTLIFILIDKYIINSSDLLVTTIIGIIIGFLSTLRIYFSIYLMLLLFLYIIIYKEKKFILLLLEIFVVQIIAYYWLIPNSELKFLINLEFIKVACKKTALNNSIPVIEMLFNEIFSLVEKLFTNLSNIKDALLILSPLVCYRKNVNLFLAYSFIIAYDYLPMLVSLLALLVLFIVGVAKQRRELRKYGNEFVFLLPFILWLFIMGFFVNVFLRIYPFRIILWFFVIDFLDHSSLSKIRKLSLLTILVISILNLYTVNDLVISYKFNYFNSMLQSFSRAFDNAPCKANTLVITAYGYLYQLHYALKSETEINKCQVIDLYDFSNMYAISNDSLMLLKKVIDSRIDMGYDVVYITSWFEYTNHTEPFFCGNFRDYYRLFSSSYNLKELYSDKFLEYLKIFKLEANERRTIERG